MADINKYTARFSNRNYDDRHVDTRSCSLPVFPIYLSPVQPASRSEMVTNIPPSQSFAKWLKAPSTLSIIRNATNPLASRPHGVHSGARFSAAGAQIMGTTGSTRGILPWSRPGIIGARSRGNLPWQTNRYRIIPSSRFALIWVNKARLIEPHCPIFVKDKHMTVSPMCAMNLTDM